MIVVIRTYVQNCLYINTSNPSDLLILNYDYGYGEPAGTQGINCHHSLYPFIEGVNTNPFHHPDTEQAIKNGDIQQKQRALERNVRRDKKLIEYGQKSGDTAGVAHYKGILSAHRAKLRELVKDNEFLHRDYSREKVVTGLASDYNSIKLTDSQKYTNLKIKSGDWGTNINEDKQLPHMESSHAPGKSYLFDGENPQKLLDEYSGKGELELTKHGEYSNKEKVKTDHSIGIDYSSGEETNWIKIHHSKSRTHIVPLRHE